MNRAATHISVRGTLANALKSRAEMTACLDRERNGDHDQSLRDAAAQAVGNTSNLNRCDLRARGGS